MANGRHVSNATVSVIDGAHRERRGRRVIGSPITVGADPYGVAVNPTTNRVYVANMAARTVSVIDGASGGIGGDGAVIGSAITVGTSPRRRRQPDDQPRLRGQQFGSTTVSVIDGASGNGGAVLRRPPIAVGDPRGVAVNPTTNRVYVPTTAATPSR